MSSSQSPIRRFKLGHRNCEACGPDAVLRNLSELAHEARTRRFRWAFQNNLVICEGCGFVFVSPCYPQSEILEYYADSFARPEAQSLDFSPAVRMAFIDGVISETGCGIFDAVVEIGGNTNSPFQSLLEERFRAVSSCEPNTDCEGGGADTERWPSGSFDLLLNYFVLEHVPDVRRFLKEAHRLLREDGVMVIEVPDLSLYPEDISALLWHEHCNHFALENLRHFAAMEGFTLLSSSSELCSRGFGMAVSFRRLRNDETEGYRAAVFHRNLEWILAGFVRLEGFRQQISDLRVTLESRGGRTVLWGANNLLLLFLAEVTEGNFVIVDSDPKKSGYGFIDSIPVQLPGDCIGKIADSENLVVFAASHSTEIQRWISDHAGRSFDDPIIVDVNSSLRPTLARPETPCS